MAIVDLPSANEQRNIGVVDTLDGVSQWLLSVASELELVVRQDFNLPPKIKYLYNKINLYFQSAWMA